MLNGPSTKNKFAGPNGVRYRGVPLYSPCQSGKGSVTSVYTAIQILLHVLTEQKHTQKTKPLCSVCCHCQFSLLVEDPSPEFTCLRDYVDCQNALKLLCLRSPICPYTSVLEKECQEKLKIGKVCQYYNNTCTCPLTENCYSDCH